MKNNNFMKPVQIYIIPSGFNKFKAAKNSNTIFRAQFSNTCTLNSTKYPKATSVCNIVIIIYLIV